MNVEDTGRCFQCPFCTACPDCAEFKKVVELKDAGINIYHHSIQLDDKPTDGDTQIEEFIPTFESSNRNNNVFIIENTNDIDISPTDVVTLLDNKKIGCPRCLHIITQANTLIQKISNINRKHVMGICDHCQAKQTSGECGICNKIVKKFVDAKMRSDQDKNKQFQKFEKIQNLLQSALAPKEKEIKDQKNYSDINIDKQIQQRLQKPDQRLPDVEHLLFQPERPRTVPISNIHTPYMDHADLELLISNRDKLEQVKLKKEHEIIESTVSDKSTISLGFDELLEQQLREDKAKERVTADAQRSDSKTPKDRHRDIKDRIKSSLLKQRTDSKLIDEKHSPLRKYHSEDSLITSFSAITDDVLKKYLKYFFPQSKVYKKFKKPTISSYELIKETQDRLVVEADEKKKKDDEIRERKIEEQKRKIEEQNRKRQARKDKKAAEMAAKKKREAREMSPDILSSSDESRYEVDKKTGRKIKKRKVSSASFIDDEGKIKRKGIQSVSSLDFDDETRHDRHRKGKFDEDDEYMDEKMGSKGERRRDREDKYHEREGKGKHRERDGKDRYHDREGKDRYRDKEGKDRYHDKEGRDRYRDKDGKDRYRDEEGRDRYYDKEGKDRYRDKEGKDKYHDKEGRDRYRDKEGKDRYHDKEGRDRYRDKEGKDRYHDEEGRDRYHDKEGKERYRDKEGKDRHRDKEGKDRYHDEEGRDRYHDKEGKERYRDKEGKDRHRDKEGTDRYHEKDGKDKHHEREGKDRYQDKEGKERYRDKEGKDRYQEKEGKDRYRDKDDKDKYHEKEGKDKYHGREGKDKDLREKEQSKDKEKKQKTLGDEGSKAPMGEDRSKLKNKEQLEKQFKEKEQHLKKQTGAKDEKGSEKYDSKRDNVKLKDGSDKTKTEIKAGQPQKEMQDKTATSKAVKTTQDAKDLLSKTKDHEPLVDKEKMDRDKRKDADEPQSTEEHIDKRPKEEIIIEKGKSKVASLPKSQDKQKELKLDSGKTDPGARKQKSDRGEVDLLNKVLASQEKEKADQLKSKQAQEEKLRKAQEAAEKKTTVGEKPFKAAIATVKEQKKDVGAKDNTEYEGKKDGKKVVDVDVKNIKTLQSQDDLILRLVKVKRDEKAFVTPPIKELPAVPVKRRLRKKKQISPSEVYSDLELDVESLKNKATLDDDVDKIIIGTQICEKKAVPAKPPPEKMPTLFKMAFTREHGLPEPQILPVEEIDEIPKKGDEVPKGIVRYALSDRTFIDKGWTMLPTEKVVRKMNVYRMHPSRPEFDWFEHNKTKGFMQYDTGEKLAEFDDNGRGRWYYRNGKLALDYYDCEETNAEQRYTIYSSGEPDERGRSRPITVLGMFDYLGNGVVFDHHGKIRLKYNQTEGVLLDREIGPVTHWKWHSLNDPPVLQQVMIDTHVAYKDPDIVKLGGVGSDEDSQLDNEEMLAIEFDNFIKEKSKKSSQKFKPFQIKMKALKINENFSLRVLDQASIYLLFRDGPTNLKLNLGMVLDHQEIVDTDTAELGEVSNNIERLPAKTDSLRKLQNYVANAKRCERVRTERDMRYKPTVPVASVDHFRTVISRPLRQTLKTSSNAATCYCKYRKPPGNKLYYDTRLV